jgi:hypothetical protein
MRIERTKGVPRGSGPFRPARKASGNSPVQVPREAEQPSSVDRPRAAPVRAWP